MGPTECSESKKENGLKKGPSTEFPYFCSIMLHRASDFRQITKKIMFYMGISLICIHFHSCTPSKSSSNDARDWCIRKTDTLWSSLAESRKNFIYKMDEIAIRKHDMDSQLRITKFMSAASLSPEEKSDIIQYNSVFRVYKPLAERYKAAVLEAEELFYNIKALDKSVRKGDYDSKTEEFKKVWQPLKQALDANLIEAKEIEGQLNNVEPMYQRLAPKIEVIVDRAMP